ncbi:MAG: hypothetical protein FWF72_02795 [Paludibacter sp.]|nr:hypothetical protein [Paludibacter sp.]
MKKVILILCVALCVLINAQAQQSWINGVYTFESAVVEAVDNSTGAQIFLYNITDSTQLAMPPFLFPVPVAVFKTAEIGGGQVVSCVMLSNGKQYFIANNRFIAADRERKINDDFFTDNVNDNFDGDEFEYSFIPSPITVAQNGDDILITIGSYVYGSSDYPTQVLRGKYTIKMKKQ